MEAQERVTNDLRELVKVIKLIIRAIFSKLVTHMTWSHPLDWNPTPSYQSTAVVCSSRMRLHNNLVLSKKRGATVEAERPSAVGGSYEVYLEKDTVWQSKHKMYHVQEVSTCLPLTHKVAVAIQPNESSSSSRQKYWSSWSSTLAVPHVPCFLPVCMYDGVPSTCSLVSGSPLTVITMSINILSPCFSTSTFKFSSHHHLYCNIMPLKPNAWSCAWLFISCVANQGLSDFMSQHLRS